jgi:rSAM/selenodomain-associated transferase 1
MRLDTGLPVDTVELSVASSDDVPFFYDAFPELLVRPQVRGDLGQRMAASFEQAFAAGAEAAVLTGSDVPGLNSQIVRAAFEALDASPVVIGPASDGGYYLIGMRAPGAPLFEGIEWSSERVLVQTEALAGAQGLVVARLSELHDVDTVEDLVRWRQETLWSDRAGQERPGRAKERRDRHNW